MTPWIGAAKKIEDIDIPRIGHEIGVGEDELHAVMDVEARGTGFDSQGRVIMLYEPHIFNREVDPSLRADAVAQGLAYTKWGAKPYPKSSYPIFERAIGMDRDAGFRSASWGFGQIMGFNCKLAGYTSAEAMVAAFADDEETHLQAMVRFIKNAGLDDELRRHDWDGFARGYNGASYAKHGYHTRLAARYKFWASKPDTPWKPSMRGCECPAEAA